jgi:hypothetical protein
MDTDKVAGVSFAPQSTLKVNIHTDAPGRAGDVFLDNPGNNPGQQTCTTNGEQNVQCVYTYNLTGATTDVMMTALPGDGATWHWENYCHGTGDNCTLTVGNGSWAEVDIYYIPQVVLNVQGQSGATGWVEITPIKDPCYSAPWPGANTCVYSFPGGTLVTLTPHPDAGFTSTWYQRCDGWGSAPCVFNAWPGETFTADIHFYVP